MISAEDRFIAIRRQRNLSVAVLVGVFAASVVSTVARVPYIPEILKYAAIATIVVVFINWKRSRRAFLDYQREKAAARSDMRTEQTHA